MPTLLWLRLEPGEQARQVIGPARVEALLGPATAVVVLTDEDVVVFEDDLVAGGRVHLERHIGEELTLVVAVEVDLEHAPDMRLVVRMVVELLAIDLDRPVVPRWPTSLCAGLSGDGPEETRGSRHHAHDAAKRSPPAAALQTSHNAEFPSVTGLRCPAVPLQRRGHGRRVGPDG
jgi:hypothetical protein